MNTQAIKTALAYVHYWEAKERGLVRVARTEAASIAARTLTEAEKSVLFRALNLE